MERLTNAKEAAAQRRAYEKRLEQGYPRNIPEERFLKLAAYEDTGLEPGEIGKIREDIESGYLKSMARRYAIDLDRLRELAKADREGRCVVLDMPRRPLDWGSDTQDACLCPWCGEDLMGITYGERMVLQCPECGQYLDSTKAITRKSKATLMEAEV